MKSLGPEINSAKCEQFIVNLTSDESKEIAKRFEDMCPGIKILDKNNFTLLGVQVFPEAIEHILKQKMNDLTLMTNRQLQNTLQTFNSIRIRSYLFM